MKRQITSRDHSFFITTSVVKTTYLRDLNVFFLYIYQHNANPADSHQLKPFKTKTVYKLGSGSAIEGNHGKTDFSNKPHLK